MYTFYEFLAVSSTLPCGNQPQNNGLNLLVALTFHVAYFKIVSSRKKIYICSVKALWYRHSCVWCCWLVLAYTSVLWGRANVSGGRITLQFSL